MKKRLDYGKLMKKWMQFYDLTAELSQKMFESIWTRLQSSKIKAEKKGAEIDGACMERTDRKSKK